MFVQAFFWCEMGARALLAQMPPKWPNEGQYLFRLFEALCFTSLPVPVEEIHRSTSQLTSLEG